MNGGAGRESDNKKASREREERNSELLVLGHFLTSPACKQDTRMRERTNKK